MAIQKISNAVIADNAIDSDNLVSGAVNAADITDGSITTAKLADDSITNAKIAPNSVTSTEIASGSVTYNQIADGTIITSKIADSQITPTKIDSAGSYTVGNITSKDYILQGISTDIASTAVDIFIYDTSKDSDGGEWRNRTQDTSWYNETLNTATRGSRREFPAVAVIVATATSVTIYDGDDTSLPMWMVFDGGYYKDFIYGLGNGPVTAIQMLNAKLCVTIKDPGEQGGLDIVDFISDSGYYINESAGGPYRSKGNIKTRNDGLDLNVDRSFYNPIISRQPNDVTMTVLPNAPIDDATGLPIPTIAVATDGGVSVIRDNGQVFNITNSGAEYNFWSSVNFTKDYKLIIDSNYINQSNNITHVVDIPESNVNQSVVNERITSLNSRYYHYDSSIPNLLLPGAFAPSIAPMKSEEFAMGADNGNPIALNIISEAPETVSGITSKAMVAYIAHNYNTGHMVGDIRGAWLSDTSTSLGAAQDLSTMAYRDQGRIASHTYTTGATTWTVTDDGIPDNTPGYFGLSVPTVAGVQYTVTLTHSPTFASTAQPHVQHVNGDQLSENFGNTAIGTNKHTFTAQGSITRVVVYSANSTTTTHTLSLNLAEQDRSVNSKGLSVYGTVTKTPVATGADLVAYGGFSGTNFLKQSYRSNLDFGTGDFCYMAWFKLNDINTTYGLFSRQTVGQDSGNRFQIQTDASGVLAVYNSGNIGNTSFSLTSMVGSWSLFAIYRRSGRLYASLNGRPGVDIGGDTADYNNSTADFVIGGLNLGTSTTIGYALNGYVSMVRVSATAPSDDQIKKIYEDEKFLFQEGAQSTLYGSSNAVTALAYDDSTELLHVGTSAGRSVFQGLRRVQNTTTAVSTAISANNELVAEQ